MCLVTFRSLVIFYFQHSLIGNDHPAMMSMTIEQDEKRPGFLSQTLFVFVFVFVLVFVFVSCQIIWCHPLSAVTTAAPC